MRRVLGLVLFSALGAILSGCGGGGVAVDGKLVDGGNPYTLAEGENVNITMASEDGHTTCNGKVEPDGTFHAKTSAGLPVPPGRYKVSIVHYRMPTGKTASPPVTVDTGEVWEVSSSNKSFTLDMAKLKDKEKPKGKDKK